ncbi:hypothetical protein K3495_g4017 [Podosphaera aphanis]|nr:hypothetical protein K3495_g4017 [Podosphaera aphanis]
MSIDAGSLAQMSSFKNLTAGNGLNMPANSFSSRRGSNIKRLSFDQSNMPAAHDNTVPTPRTSRSHLLAGLRTAPKCSTPTATPFTAPPNQIQHNLPNEVHSYAENLNYGGPKTSNFLGYQSEYGQVNKSHIQKNQIYSSPEQILAPPEINVDDYGHEQMDPNYYAHLVATNMYLAEQQQRLHQQLINVQAAAQQFQGLSLGMQQQYSTPPITPRNLYQQQVKNHLQSIGAPVSGSQLPLYSYLNSVTGQPAFIQLDQQTLQYETMQKLHSATLPPSNRFASSPRPRAPQTSSESSFSRSVSPPTKSQSPGLSFDHTPLPPPSAGAFRRAHRKAPSSLAFGFEDASLESPRSSFLPKGMGLSSACISGFGPGQGRIGEHPVRQPRGPPSLDELISKPTTKFEGSKNFATRTRRSAVNNLVRAGIERRRAPGSTGSGSASSVSEIGEVSLSVTDNDSDSGRSGSGSLTSRPALGSPRTSIHGAIGSNRPSSRENSRSLERKSVASLDSSYTSATVSSDEGNVIGGKFASIFRGDQKKFESTEAKSKAPKLILTPAEKLKAYF